MSAPAGLEPLDVDVNLAELERSVRLTARERMYRAASGFGGWVREHGVDLAILAVLTSVAVVVHMHGMYDTPERFDDEGTYTAYAWAVQNEHRLGHYTYWYAHPPLGWIQIAGWDWLTGALHRAPYAIAGVRQFMVVSKIASVVLLYALALRLRMTRAAASIAVLIFALSPLAVYFTRTALLDNIVTPWLLAAFYLAASPQRRIGAAVGSAACFAVAVLSKETALLFLPALALLFWQCADHRNRKFSATMFGATLALLVVLYPTYALVKNELFEGPGHVSLIWAIKWQLFERVGSGSIFNHHSTAHAVVSSWVIQDPWFTRLALVAIVPGLLARRTRAVALALGTQVSELVRSGYLPYSFVVAMIPFAALTIAGVGDELWQTGRLPLPARLARTRAGARLMRDRPAERSVLDGRGRTLLALIRFVARRRRPRPTRRRRSRLGVLAVCTVRASLIAGLVALILAVRAPWVARIHNLWYVDHDAGAATALSWVRANVARSQRIVIDDAFWVDLVEHGYAQDRTIWFTKLDVDSAVKLPGKPAWRAIDFVVLTYQDELSLHMTLDDRASPDTRTQFPTLGAALTHAEVVAKFGTGADRVVIWRVMPDVPIGGAHADGIGKTGGGP